MSARRLLTVAQTADQLGVSADTVYRPVESGEWPSVRLGSGPKAPIRIDSDELRVAIREHVGTPTHERED